MNSHLQIGRSFLSYTNVVHIVTIIGTYWCHLWLHSVLTYEHNVNPIVQLVVHSSLDYQYINTWLTFPYSFSSCWTLHHVKLIWLWQGGVPTWTCNISLYLLCHSCLSWLHCTGCCCGRIGRRCWNPDYKLIMWCGADKSQTVMVGETKQNTTLILMIQLLIHLIIQSLLLFKI